MRRDFSSFQSFAVTFRPIAEMALLAILIAVEGELNYWLTFP